MEEEIKKKIHIKIKKKTMSKLIAYLTNDSTLYVSPIFWILLGIGVNSNFKLKEIIEDKK